MRYENGRSICGSSILVEWAKGAPRTGPVSVLLSWLLSIFFVFKCIWFKLDVYLIINVCYL